MRDVSRLLALVLTVALPFVGGAVPAGAAGAPLRSVDWLDVLQHDPAITIDPNAYQPPVEFGPYISVDAAGSAGDTLSGYASLDDVSYGDLDGDGAEEAVIPIFSGGTAGMLGFLLYREGAPAPKLVLAQSGYKMSASIEDTQLIVYQPNYVGFEPNCCPSSSTRSAYKLRGDSLVKLTEETEPNDVQEVTVWAFYQAVVEKRYEDAYAFYSPGFQANTPFQAWRAGYAQTRSIDVDTSPGATPTEVRVALTVTDNQPGGGTVTRRFRGTWTLVWSAEQRRWLLDRAQIQAA